MIQALDGPGSSVDSGKSQSGCAIFDLQFDLVCIWGMGCICGWGTGGKFTEKCLLERCIVSGCSLPAALQLKCGEP